MRARYIIILSCPSLCQKLSKLVKIWQSYAQKILTVYFETRCIASDWYKDMAVGQLPAACIVFGLFLVCCLVSRST